MIDKLKAFFSAELAIDSEETKQDKLNEACAALLIEVALADQEQSELEVAAIRKVLHQFLKLSHSKLDELLKHSLENGADNISVYPFTSLINEHYAYEQKVELISLMWRVAFADNKLDKYEDVIIRKVADLLYVSHRDFIKTKLSVLDESKNDGL